jgi:hypothetical protein
MNTLIRFIAGAALAHALVVTVSAQAPSLDAARAARLATDYLATLGSKAPHIVSITLEKGALVSGSQSWIVRWSEPIQDGANHEIGVRVKMDGTLAHLVENTEAKRKRATARPILR